MAQFLLLECVEPKLSALCFAQIDQQQNAHNFTQEIFLIRKVFFVTSLEMELVAV